MAESGEKTEQPTDKRLQDAKKKGQVAKSQDLSSAVLLLSAVGILWLAGSYVGGFLKDYVADQLKFAVTMQGDITPEIAFSLLLTGLKTATIVLAPLLGVIFLLAFLTNYLQVGSIISFESIKPDPNKLNPVSSFQNKFFKMRAYVELAKTIIKMTITASVVLYVFWYARNDLAKLTVQPIDVGVTFAFNLIIEIGLKVGFVFLLLGGADFFLQKMLHRKEMMMTKHEVKEEYKQSEGNPLIKGQRRFLHRQLLSENMSAAVKKSNVVVVNPTHIAVALSYERGADSAPVILAKGADLMALQIREIANEAKVPVMRDIPLARALYELEIETEIPEELYEATAVVLRWVYDLAEERRETVKV